LRRLIDEADASAALLARALDRLRERERRTNHASVHLQERLRVGAQLLQALQSQIDRLDESIRGRQRTLESLESRVALMLERAERLEHAIESAEVNLAVKTSRLGDVETSK
jgi:chromosome segregation ATPase